MPMDLVEIRKKAKRGKVASPAKLSGEEDKHSAVEATVTSPAVPDVQVETAASVDRQGPGVPDIATGQVLDGQALPVTDDALEQLFRGQDDLALATEESYLKALQGGGEETLQARQRWLAFALGSERYAVNIDYVNEIIKPREITQIPRVPAFLLGIISLRGIIVPIIDLRRRLDLGTVEFDEQTRILVCEEDDRIAGLLVDSITQVVHLTEDEIEPPPAILTGVNRDLVEGVGRIRGQMVILLDLPKVLDMELN